MIQHHKRCFPYYCLLSRAVALVESWYFFGCKLGYYLCTTVEIVLKLDRTAKLSLKSFKRRCILRA